MAQLCPVCKETFDLKQYKKTHRCSACGNEFELDDAVDSKKSGKKKDNGNASARSKYQRVSKNAVIKPKSITQDDINAAKEKGLKSNQKSSNKGNTVRETLPRKAKNETRAADKVLSYAVEEETNQQAADPKPVRRNPFKAREEENINNIEEEAYPQDDTGYEEEDVEDYPEPEAVSPLMEMVNTYGDEEDTLEEVLSPAEFDEPVLDDDIYTDPLEYDQTDLMEAMPMPDDDLEAEPVMWDDEALSIGDAPKMQWEDETVEEDDADAQTPIYETPAEPSFEDEGDLLDRQIEDSYVNDNTSYEEDDTMVITEQEQMVNSGYREPLVEEEYEDDDEYEDDEEYEEDDDEYEYDDDEYDEYYDDEPIAKRLLSMVLGGRQRVAYEDEEYEYEDDEDDEDEYEDDEYEDDDEDEEEESIVQGIFGSKKKGIVGERLENPDLKFTSNDDGYYNDIKPVFKEKEDRFILKIAIRVIIAIAGMTAVTNFLIWYF